MTAPLHHPILDGTPVAGSVSVVMTCFNEGPWIGEAVRSVLGQTAAARIADIVVVDDGSREDTLAVLEEIQRWDPRITVKRERGNGVSKARNLGVAATTGEWIAFLDSDDHWHPDKLQRQLDRAAASPGVGFLYSGFWLFENGRPETSRPITVVDHGRARDPVVAFFRHDPPAIPSSMLVRRSVFDQTGGFDSDVKVFEDFEFSMRVSQVTAMCGLPEPLVHKRMHASSMTSGRSHLMMHHATVAFRFAAREPRVAVYVSRRLAERARKLGNLEAIDGNDDSARTFYALAVSLWPWSPMAWLMLAAHRIGGGPLVRRLRGSKGGGR